MDHQSGQAAPPLYRSSLERDACGVALVADVAGRPSRDLVERALVALDRLTHRGATAAGHTIDGAGVLLQIPWDLLEAAGRRDRTVRVRALGAFFVPGGVDRDARALVDHAAAASGWRLAQWREVPVSPHVIAGARAAHAPLVRHAVFDAIGGTSRHAARSLLDARRRIEHAARVRGLGGLAVVSLSARTVVYKGLVTPAELPRYYPDLTDPRCASAVAIVHQRFSTNTLARWELAQPFRLIAHNGEINTIAGNRAWARARERDAAALPGWSGADLGPIVTGEGSDSCSLDEMVGLLAAAGIGLPHALSRLIPPAWEGDDRLSADERAFYAFQTAASEPWDGPAAVAFSDGQVTGLALDRNGFRPARFVLSRAGRVYAGSEAGIFDLDPGEVLERGRLGPGEMLAADATKGLVRHGAGLRRALAISRPYRRWVERAVTPNAALPPRLDAGLPPPDEGSEAQWLRWLRLFGCDREELEVILRPLTGSGQEAVGSMGDDTPPAALSPRPRLLSDYFRQRFAQVTNPPMDPLRERAVMSLAVLVGRRSRLLDETGGTCRLVALESPVLAPDALGALAGAPALAAVRLDLACAASAGAIGLLEALGRLEAAAEAAVRDGAALLVLSDRHVPPGEAVLPALLATAAVHQRLSDAGLRLQASLIVETGEARDAHQTAVLLAFGASAVCPWLGMRAAEHFAGPSEPAAAAHARYRRGLEAGLLKVFSKMGVSTASAYVGSALFETLGLAPDVRARYFPDAPGFAGAVTLDAIFGAALDRGHEAARAGAGVLRHHGAHGYRRDGEYHAFNPEVVRRLHAVAVDRSATAYAAFREAVERRPPAAVRDLLDLRDDLAPVPIDDVEPAASICRRFFASAMSVGALSPEAHRLLAVAMNRLGGRSNSGEGGEEVERCRERGGAASANSGTKQVASGRFGVTPAYLISAAELQIKMAQGSKPGEGGQLPAAKVVDYIARLRFAQPGTALISPPPHHDIYSIEDLAQLVADLRAFSPAARINVKLVAQMGVGIVAAGVAKAGAGAIQISGHSGGTGASPRGSIKHAGMPWELGVAEAHQVLAFNGLRDRVVLQVDGGLTTGRDIVLAAALGAEEFGFGTAALVAAGCVMARQCHLNTCPVGIATQRADLRAKFTATADQVGAYFRLVAEDVRGILASLGVRSVADLVGRADLLRPREPVAASLDVTPLLHRVRSHEPEPAARERDEAHTRPSERLAPTLNDEIAALLAPRLGTEPLEWISTIRNTDRTVGARLAGIAADRFGNDGPPHPVALTFNGTAGQSFAAWSVPGLSFVLTGEANDYVGKGMHGGQIVIRPPARPNEGATGRIDARFETARPGVGGGVSPRGGPLGWTAARGEATVLAGNAVLYGATGGRLFMAGAAGERFAVRNSGATAVVEGVGDHACEYMTGGTVVVLGRIGRNFAAGMTGGVAFVRGDRAGVEAHCNLDLVALDAVDRSDLATLRELLAEHARLTGSARAAALVAGPDVVLAGGFCKVAPVPAVPAASEPAHAAGRAG